MKIKVSIDRSIFINAKKLGQINENNFEILEFAFPEEIDSYSKYIEFDTDDGKYVDTIENNKYTITRALSKYDSVKVQIVCKDLSNDIVFKSNTFTLPFDSSINASEELEEESQGLLDTILLDLQECQEDISDIQGILETQDTAIEGLQDGKVDKVEGKGLSTNDYTDAEKTKLAGLENYDDTEIKGDIADLQENKADKSELPDVSNFVTKDANDLINYTLKTSTGSLIDLEINGTTYVVTLSLKDVDGNVISTDTIDLPLESVVIGGTFDSVNKKIVLTLENGNTVDIPVGDLVAGLQTEITSSNKLASDLVDDTNSGNKFTNTTEKIAWNAKYDKPSGGIPKTDLASDVQTSLGKADTALQEHQSLADYVKNTDYATSSKGGVFKTQPNYATNMYQGYLYANAKSYADYLSASPGMFIGKTTLENVITGKNLETANNKVTSISSSSTDTQYPSAKCVYDLVGDIESVLEALDIGGGI